jgi:predicted acyl esterase
VAVQIRRDILSAAPRRQDGIATLEWLARQPWFDGRVATWGASAYGYTQWAISDRHDLGLRALNIQIASSRFGGMFHQGGAFALESALYWALYSRGPVDIVPTKRDDRPRRQWLAFDRSRRSRRGERPFFDDWLTHAAHEDYWKQIDGDDRARKVAALCS